MKRIVCLVLMIVVLLCAGCTAPFLNYNNFGEITNTENNGQGTPLFEFVDDPAVTAFVENFETDFPVSVTVNHTTVAGGLPHTVTDEGTIRAVYDALSGITVLQYMEEGHTDDDLSYYFTMQDGSSVGFAFQSSMYMDKMSLYQVTGFSALTAALPYPNSEEAEESSYYENDTLGFWLTLLPGWQPHDTGYDEIGGTIEFIPDESLYGTSDYFLSVTFLSGVSLQGAIQKSDGFVDGGIVIQEGDTQIGGAQAYGVVYEETVQDGAVYSTCLYMVDGGGENCYYLYYTVANEFNMIDRFANDIEEIIASFIPKERTLAAQTPTPEPEETSTPEPQPQQTTAQQDGEVVDYMQLTGLYTPADIEAMYGAPDETEDNTAEGMAYILYHYRNASISFAPDGDGGWLVDGVMNYRPSSPILVGGVSVGMDSYSAEETLLDNGYTYETTDAQGYMYYAAYDERVILCLVTLLVDENLVAEASGWYGPVAESILATDGGA